MDDRADSLFCVEDEISEQQFAELTQKTNLTEAQRESLRRYYGLPHNEGLVLNLGIWMDFAICAVQKIRGNFSQDY
jgi:hypothetical protein